MKRRKMLSSSSQDNETKKLRSSQESVGESTPTKPHRPRTKFHTPFKTPVKITCIKESTEEADSTACTLNTSITSTPENTSTPVHRESSSQTPVSRDSQTPIKFHTPIQSSPNTVETPKQSTKSFSRLNSLNCHTSTSQSQTPGSSHQHTPSAKSSHQQTPSSKSSSQTPSSKSFSQTPRSKSSSQTPSSKSSSQTPSSKSSSQTPISKSSFQTPSSKSSSQTPSSKSSSQTASSHTFHTPVRSHHSSSPMQDFLKHNKLKKELSEKESLLRKYKQLDVAMTSGEYAKMEEELRKWREVCREILEKLYKYGKDRDQNMSMSSLVQQLRVNPVLVGFNESTEDFSE